MAVTQQTHHPTTSHISYPIQSHIMKMMIFIGIWLQSYFAMLLYLSHMYYKQYIINWIIGSILITIMNMKDLGPCRDVPFRVFDVIFAIVDTLLIIVLRTMHMNIKMVIISQLYMMYVMIHLF